MVTTIPNEKLMEEAMLYDKFIIRDDVLTHWYVNESGNEGNGILQEDIVSFQLIKECLAIYEETGEHQMFWSRWDDFKRQYNWDNKEGDESISTMLQDFIEIDSDYPVVSSKEFNDKIRFSGTKESFERFIRWLRKITTPVEHELKCDWRYYNAILVGDKTFEVRFNDRDYRKGDVLLLRSVKRGEYTGDKILRKVTYVLDNEDFVKKGFVILGIKAL